MKLNYKHRIISNMLDIDNVANFDQYHPEYNVVVHVQVQETRKSRIG